MKQLNFVIENATGLHARPAKVFVKTAKKFKSDIRIAHGSKKVNAKSLIAVLGLGVKHGGSVQVELDGEDEDLAAEALETAVSTGLGEDDAAHKPAPQPVAANGVAKTAVPKAPKDGLAGIGAAPGLAIGPVFQLKQTAVQLTDAFAGVAAEQNRLYEALAAGKEALHELRRQLETHAPEEAAIFEVHQELLTDEDLLESVQQKIQGQQNAEQAWRATIEERAAIMAALDDPLLAARAADIRDVGNRVLKLLTGASSEVAWPDHPVVVIAHDLTPSDTATLDPQKVLGFATAVGGPTAHSAIIARALSA